MRGHDRLPAFRRKAFPRRSGNADCDVCPPLSVEQLCPLCVWHGPHRRYNVEADEEQLSGGPGTTYVDCGNTTRTLVVDNHKGGTYAYDCTKDSSKGAELRHPQCRDRAWVTDNETLFEFDAILLYNQAHLGFKPVSANGEAVIVSVGKLGGDRTGTLWVGSGQLTVLSASAPAAANAHDLSPAVVERLAAFEHSVTVERHFYMRDGGAHPASNVFVEEGATLLCPDRLMVRSVEMWVFGHLKGVVDLVVSSEDPSSTVFDCQHGQGPIIRGSAYLAQTAHNSEGACADQCNSRSDCKAFDFTTSARDDACRLYGFHAAALSRLGDPGTYGRQYCTRGPLCGWHPLRFSDSLSVLSICVRVRVAGRCFVDRLSVCLGLLPLCSP